MGTKSNAKPTWAADVDSGDTKSSKATLTSDKGAKRTDEKTKLEKNDHSPLEEDQVEEVSDMEWMRRRMVSSEITEQKEFEQDDSDVDYGEETKKDVCAL